jgi:hypothetical protein
LPLGYFSDGVSDMILLPKASLRSLM